MAPVSVAFIVYDGFTLLDFAGVYDPVTRLRTMGFVPDLSYIVCARQEVVHSSEGITIIPDAVNIPLPSFDYIVIPGGNSVKDLMNDRQFLDWITVSGPVIASVCGGSLLLGAAGILRGRKATTHPGLRSVLAHFADAVSEERIVEDHGVITAGGVTSAIDLGLYICERIAGCDVREKIASQMDYPHYQTGLR